MIEFLNLVAKHYATQVLERGALAFERMLFVFPNRRSSLYFQQYLSECVGQPILAPESTTINEFYGRFSDLEHVDRTELLFRLYRDYRDVVTKHGGECEDFDKFVFWGDILLADFNEVDQYLVDAHSLFRNVRDLNEIDEEFCIDDPEMLEIIRRFWKNFNPGTSSNSSFVATWSILYDLYSTFREHLLADGKAYDGMMKRWVEEHWSDIGDVILGDEHRFAYDKIVFVGLTAISKVEHHLLVHLRARGLAEFCWDNADSRLRMASSQAARFQRDYTTDLPNVFTDEQLQATIVPDTEKEVITIGVPSGVGQTAKASEMLRRWISEGVIDVRSENKSDHSNPFHTAVVLPDEKLLVPMLYAVPEDFNNYNVTMGYSLSETPVAGLIDLLLQLQVRARLSADGEPLFYYKTVFPLLAHSFIKSSAEASGGQSLIGKIVSEGQSFVPRSRLVDGADPLLQSLFVFCKKDDAREVVRYLKGFLLTLLRNISARMADDAELDPDESTGEDVKMAMEREFIDHYEQAVEGIERLLDEFKMNFKISTFFHLLQRLVKGDQVPFSGEPLSGLQLMGVLETRALDFDNLIIMSMNEGVYPAKASSNTFIPNSLRKGFGLTLQTNKDAVATYHFYRLLSRAKRVVLIYDTRATGMQTGERSRFLMQMQYLHKFKIKQLPVRFDVSSVDGITFEVEKNDAVMKSLRKFCVDGDPKACISASSIKTYLNCPFRFYLQYVEGINEDDEISEDVENNDFGSIYHETMQEIYDRFKGRKIDSGVLTKLYKDRAGVLDLVKKHFVRVMRVNDVEGYNLLLIEMIAEYVINTLKYDANDPLFTYVASESKQILNYAVSDQLQVKLKGIYDRLDVDNKGTLRVIDYKTGSYKGARTLKTQIGSLYDLFDPNSNKGSQEAMQALLYCMMLRRATPQDWKDMGIDYKPVFDRISPRLYFTRTFSMPKAETKLTLDSSSTGGAVGEIENFELLNDEFETEFRGVLSDIFDRKKAFVQCEDVKKCRYCPFAVMCKRG